MKILGIVIIVVGLWVVWQIFGVRAQMPTWNVDISPKEAASKIKRALNVRPARKSGDDKTPPDGWELYGGSPDDFHFSCLTADPASGMAVIAEFHCYPSTKGPGTKIVLRTGVYDGNMVRWADSVSVPYCRSVSTMVTKALRDK